MLTGDNRTTAEATERAGITLVGGDLNGLVRARAGRYDRER